MLKEAGIPISNLLTAVATVMSMEDIVALMAKARDARGIDVHERLQAAAQGGPPLEAPRPTVTPEMLILRATTLSKLETDINRAAWFAGYVRGVRRASHGEGYGTEEEHEQWLTFESSVDRHRAMLGRGYRAG